jgi:crotonobetainyl-CoA:carnitine CoA-transferase CaiB-like acyl-CoA transferase
MWSRPLSSTWRRAVGGTIVGRPRRSSSSPTHVATTNHPRADRWCSLLSLEPDFVRKIAREIARGEIDVSRRLKDYRAQRDRYRRELRLAVRSPAAGSWSK